MIAGVFLLIAALLVVFGYLRAKEQDRFERCQEIEYHLRMATGAKLARLLEESREFGCSP